MRMDICDVCGLPCKDTAGENPIEYLDDEDVRYQMSLSKLLMEEVLNKAKGDVCNTCTKQVLLIHKTFVEQRRAEAFDEVFNKQLTV